MAGETLFGRRVEVILAAPLEEDLASLSAEVTEITQLRVSFKVTKSLVKDPNTCEVKIYNLAASTRAKLPGAGAKVLLKAGYAETLEQIYVGDAYNIESKREGVEWVTTLQCGDGHRATLHARTSGSFAPGTGVGEVINTLAKATKLHLGNIGQVASQADGEYTQGYSAHGLAVKELESVLTRAGYELSIQDGTLQILKPGEVTTEPMIELSPTTGLIGSPEFASGEHKSSTGKQSKHPPKPVLKAKSLLQGQLTPGRRVKVVSRVYQGEFRCSKVEHTGDTAGGDWYSACELEAL